MRWLLLGFVLFCLGTVAVVDPGWVAGMFR